MKSPKVMVVQVQQQQGTVDCSLFAIAYAVSLATGKDSARIKFQQQCMTSFFVDCIKKRHIDTFPIEKEIPYSLDQTPLSNSGCTSGSAERNSRRSRIVAVPRLLFEKHAARGHASRLVLDGRYKKSNDKYLAVF